MSRCRRGSGPSFLMELSAAVRMGTVGPPALSRFLLRQEFWQRLGMRPDDIEALPQQEFVDYCSIIQVMRREEQAQAKKGAASRGVR